MQYECRISIVKLYFDIQSYKNESILNLYELYVAEVAHITITTIFHILKTVSV